MSEAQRLLQLTEGFQTTKLGSATIEWDISDTDAWGFELGRHINLFSLRVPRAARGKGEAKAIMTQFCAMADEKRLPILLLASGLDARTRTNRLVDFYVQFGFDLAGRAGNAVGDPWMIRMPR